ncbi:hypothetical protein HK407_02g03570 [Ordospora pajunii]|uniref:uncharacterized protein n=1 Tax=Ordospora pajunii TaxID=3039483 RepID=UPI00295266C7|nr:uncharacterized protein HK407_02g03570 [Ordospora pajunii]KAH9411912.1 hypothetical protein HK407_02g03570 [Ordospora pajunii]
MKSIIFNIAFYYLLKAACADSKPNESTATGSESTESVEQLQKPEGEGTSTDATNPTDHQISTIDTDGLTQSETEAEIKKMNPNMTPAISTTLFVDSSKIHDVPAVVLDTYRNQVNMTPETKTNYFVINGENLASAYGKSSGSANQPTTESDETTDSNQPTGESSDNTKPSSDSGTKIAQTEGDENKSPGASAAALRSRSSLMKKAGKAR